MSQTSWGAIEDLVLAARERPPAERETFVRTHCADPVLQDTISALFHDAAALFTRVDAPDVQLEAGSRVGPYIVMRRLGRGGMGEVFLASDTRLDRAVALKCLTSGAGEDLELHDLIVREARAAARINHPHVATVHDVVEDGTRTFIVMEYVEGESLAAILRAGALPADRVVEIGRQLASALAAAHRTGIIHRDLKPANVQVMGDGAVKILDFGIAAASVVATTATTRTDLSVYPRQAAPTAGTPGYMSPEQMVGLSVDERSDVFSLGVVLFEAVTGRKAVERGDPLDVLALMIKGLPRADAISSSVPDDLADVIAKSLAPDPQQRFQSATEFQAALDAIGKPSAGERRALGWLRKAVTAFFGLFLTIWLLGILSSAAYNITLERPAAFAVEPRLAHFVWGIKSLVAPLVLAALALIATWSGRFVLRIAALWPPLDQWLTQVQRRSRAVADRLSLNDPSVLAQALTTCGILAILLIVWRFGSLISAWTAFINRTQTANLVLLGPGESDRELYRQLLTVLLLSMAAGLLRVLRLRRTRRIRRGRGPVVALSAIVAVILLLLETPYRIMWKNDAPRAVLAGERCYVIGDNGREYLVYCPGLSPPRNRVVAKTDPSLKVSGVVESIFTPAVR
jgi:hypothetical protein